jgi:prepilin-type N-terminal cleavage/methylation domain-containing protein
MNRFRRSRGFTLLELLVSLVILVAAFTTIWHAFSATFGAWERGTKLLDGMHNGDYVMEQLVSALRSAAFFKNSPHIYGFWLEARGGQYPRDEISWVTSGTAFLPPDHPLGNGLYRVALSIEDNNEGDPAVAVRAYPHTVNVEDYDAEAWYVSTKVKGLECIVYNFEEEDWESEWEDTNAVPSLVKVSLYMDPIEQYGRPVVMERLVEIPIGMAVTSKLIEASATVGDQAGTQPDGTTPTPGAPTPGAPGGAPTPAPRAGTPGGNMARPQGAGP